MILLCKTEKAAEQAENPENRRRFVDSSRRMGKIFGNEHQKDRRFLQRIRGLTARMESNASEDGIQTAKRDLNKKIDLV